jgi:peroxiredoxin Q/BCP
VSPDKVQKLEKFEEKKKLNFNVLSDLDLEVSKKYDVYGKKKFMGKEYMGIKRMTFIIDKSGKLKHVLDDVRTKTHHEEVLAYIGENLN